MELLDTNFVLVLLLVFIKCLENSLFFILKKKPYPFPKNLNYYYSEIIYQTFMYVTIKFMK